MSKTQLVLSSVSNGVMLITLNRPEELNCITVELADALAAKLREAQEDTEVRCIVLTGAGEHFSAGGNMQDLIDTIGGGQSRDDLRLLAESNRLLYESKKPTIAMIRGFAAGGGIALAAACDFRFAEHGARLAFGFTNIGLAGDMGGSIFVSRILGRSRALEFMVLSKYWNATVACEKGLLTGVFEASDLREKTLEIAQRVASLPPLGVAALKENIEGAQLPFDEAIDVEAENFLRCRATRDHREATVAFIEKRPALFEGR